MHDSEDQLKITNGILKTEKDHKFNSIISFLKITSANFETGSISDADATKMIFNSIMNEINNINERLANDQSLVRYNKIKEDSFYDKIYIKSIEIKEMFRAEELDANSLREARDNVNELINISLANKESMSEVRYHRLRYMLENHLREINNLLTKISGHPVQKGIFSADLPCPCALRPVKNKGRF